MVNQFLVENVVRIDILQKFARVQAQTLTFLTLTDNLTDAIHVDLSSIFLKTVLKAGSTSIAVHRKLTYVIMYLDLNLHMMINFNLTWNLVSLMEHSDYMMVMNSAILQNQCAYLQERILKILSN